MAYRSIEVVYDNRKHKFIMVLLCTVLCTLVKCFQHSSSGEQKKAVKLVQVNFNPRK